MENRSNRIKIPNNQEAAVSTSGKKREWMNSYKTLPAFVIFLGDVLPIKSLFSTFHSVKITMLVPLENHFMKQC